MTATFKDGVAAVVRDFLETALVVDDEATLVPVDQAQEQASAETANARDVANLTPARGDLTLVAPDEAELAEADQEHPLMAKVLIDAFADVGIVCSVLALDKGDPIQKRFLSAAARADLLIIDWELNRDGGDTARELISGVLQQDAAAERKRLRVISIYTGQPGLVAIVGQIRDHLGLQHVELTDNGVTLAHANVRITAFSKPLNDARLPELLKAREVPEGQLPEQLVQEFAALTYGLVPAVALASLAAIRNDTHRILQALSSELDVGYLGHRAALPFPEDAQGHLVDMIVAEIGSILGENDVGARADVSVIRAWLSAECSDDPALECGSALPFKAVFEQQEMETISEKGLGLEEELLTYEREGLKKDKKLKHLPKYAAHLFARDAASAELSGNTLANRMAVRTIYTRPARRLRLGTIVAKDGEYAVCVQPRCDSVRLPPGEARKFPFLPLRKVGSTPDTHRDFVVEDASAGGAVSLKLTTKPFSLSMYEFKGGSQRFVEAQERSDDQWVFVDADNAEFRWVAELKPEFAQRVAIDLGANVVRVGLAESELVRLSRR